MATIKKWGFPGGSAVEETPASAGDIRNMISALGSGKSPGWRSLEGYSHKEPDVTEAAEHANTH